MPDIRPFLTSGSSSGSCGKLLDSEPDSLLIYHVLFCNLSDFHCISTLNIQYTHSIFELDQCVRVVFVIMCMQSNFELFAYNPLSQHSDRKFGKRTISCVAVRYLVRFRPDLICYPALSVSGYPVL